MNINYRFLCMFHKEDTKEYVRCFGEPSDNGRGY